MVLVLVYDNSREFLGVKVFVEGRDLPVCMMSKMLWEAKSLVVAIPLDIVKCTKGF